MKRKLFITGIIAALFLFGCSKSAPTADDLDTLKPPTQEDIDDAIATAKGRLSVEQQATDYCTVLLPATVEQITGKKITESKQQIGCMYKSASAQGKFAYMVALFTPSSAPIGDVKANMDNADKQIDQMTGGSSAGKRVWVDVPQLTSDAIYTEGLLYWAHNGSTYSVAAGSLMDFPTTPDGKKADLNTLVKLAQAANAGLDKQ